MNAQELVDSGLRIGGNNFTAYGFSLPELIAAVVDKYAGCVALKPSDSVPAEIAELASDRKHAWAQRVYCDDQSHERFQHGQIVYDQPDFWLICWSTPEIETSYSASCPWNQQISFEEFNMRRSAGIEERG